MRWAIAQGDKGKDAMRSLTAGDRMSPGMLQALRRLLVFIAILMSGGSLLIPRIPLMVAVIILCFIIKGSSFGLRKEMAGIGFLMIAVLIVALSGSDQFEIGPIAIRYSNFLLGALMLGVYCDLPYDTLSKDVRPIFFWMSWQAIFTPVFALLTPSLFIAVYNPGMDHDVYTMFGIFNYHIMVDDPQVFLRRPNGFFFEPGVFQLYLNIYLFFSAFIIRRRFDVLLALCAVISTQSTTGIVLAFGTAGAYFLRYLRTASFTQKWLALVIAPVILTPLAFAMLSNVNDKFYGKSAGSAEARAYDLYTGLSIAWQYPVLGIGFDYERYYREAQEHGYKDVILSDEAITNRSNSNGVVAVLYTVGVPLAIIFFLGMIRQRFFRPSLWFSVIMFASLSSESIFYTPFLLMIVYSGLLLRPKKPAVHVAGSAVARYA